MKHRSDRVFALMALLLMTFSLVLPLGSYAQEQIENELTATKHLFPDVGPGLRAIKSDGHGRYYFLSTLDHSVRVYTAENDFVRQIPASAASGSEAISYGEDADVDSAGDVYVADRGANKITTYTSDGKLKSAFSVDSPTSVAALANGEIAVATLKSRNLVAVYDANGKYLREFGDLSDLAEHEAFNRELNVGRLASDRANHIYYAFTYSPEPTVRKYDPFGYSLYQISLHTLDIYPNAQAQRRSIARIDLQSAPQPLPEVINAIAVDPQTEEVWFAVGDVLMKFDKNGNRLERYRTLTTGGEDLNGCAILIEPHRILLGDNPHGIFAFARPDQPSARAAKTK